MGSVTMPYGSVSRLRLYEARICLDLALHAYPWYNQRQGSPTLLRPAFAALPRVGRFARRQPLSTPGLGLTRTRRYWNINQLCIDYAFRPRLSSRLTLGGLAFPRNPWAFGGGVSHPSLATHTRIRTRTRSTTVHTAASRQSSTLPYHSDPESPQGPEGRAGGIEIRSFGS
jgi:hypothetical protein